MPPARELPSGSREGSHPIRLGAQPPHIAAEVDVCRRAQWTARHRQLELVTGELRSLSRPDPLTGLGNRLAMQEELSTPAQRADRYGHRYTVALLDLDNSKGLNDGHGHRPEIEHCRR